MVCPNERERHFCAIEQQIVRVFEEEMVIEGAMKEIYGLRLEALYLVSLHQIEALHLHPRLPPRPLRRRRHHHHRPPWLIPVSYIEHMSTRGKKNTAAHTHFLAVLRHLVSLK